MEVRGSNMAGKKKPGGAKGREEEIEHFCRKTLQTSYVTKRSTH